MSRVNKKSNRVGLSFGGDIILEKAIRFAEIAEKKGFESVWVAEHFGMGREPFISLAAMASITTKIKLASGVVGSYASHPAILAFKLGTLDEYCKGRLIFGIGTGNLTRMENRLCIYPDKPLTHLKESCEIIKRILSGENVTYKGKYYSVSDLNLGFPPFRKKIPIYIGVIKDQSLKLAVRLGDGVLFSAASPPGYITHAIKVMKKEAKKIGRSFEEIDIGCIIICSCSEESELARDSVKERIASFLSRPIRGEFIMKHANLDESLIPPIRKALENREKALAMKKINDDIIDNLSIAGTPSECKKAMKRFRDAGIKLPILALSYSSINESINTFGLKN